MVASKKPKMTSAAQPKTAALASNEPYIMSAVYDRSFFIFTPFIVAAVFLVGFAAGLGEQAAFIAATVGAAGHHLPGMMRAYADRELFAQYRLRFVAAPVALILICAWAMYAKVAAVNAVMLVWGFWHGLAQLYGFARIYDRKNAGTSIHQGRFDLMLLILWFGNGVVNSDNRTAELLSLLVDCGLGSVSANQLTLVGNVWLGAAVIFSFVYLIHTFVLGKRGIKPSINKILLLILSLAYWNLVMISVPVTILSIALFELFHDVQYLAIVWSFNKNRTNKGLLSARFEKALYTTGAFGVGLYLIVVGVYGAAALGQYWFTSTEVRQAAIVFFTVSTLLHFYYDGFIWKLRNNSISSSLKLESSGTGAKKGVPEALTHGIKWISLLLVIGGLALSQSFDQRDLLAKRTLVQSAVPDSLRAKIDLIEAVKEAASAAEQAQKQQEAIRLYKRVLELSPSDRAAQDALLRLSTDIPINFLE